MAAPNDLKDFLKTVGLDNVYDKTVGAGIKTVADVDEADAKEWATACGMVAMKGKFDKAKEAAKGWEEKKKKAAAEKDAKESAEKEKRVTDTIAKVKTGGAAAITAAYKDGKYFIEGKQLAALAAAAGREKAKDALIAAAPFVQTCTSAELLAALTFHPMNFAASVAPYKTKISDLAANLVAFEKKGDGFNNAAIKKALS
jgi:hypothetical protein